ncbi:MAG TPA: segregation/condensation protein A [Polyangiaceae bacterium]|jgi:segregation and condensation protein A|nr:segregation/condensation protein A [Polyangiaceae bacterium]
MSDDLPREPPPEPLAAEERAVPEPDAAATAAAHVGTYSVKLPTFEGPLDLLLHLIEEHELDVMDIPIAFVAQKYVEYITLMEELNIDVASEYLVMAATLTHIKSKMLLPVVPTDQEDEAELELDPRAELVRRLLEYQKYKHAAEQLAGNPVLGRDIFLRGVPAPSVEGAAPLAGLSLFKLLDAFQGVLSRAKTTVDHQIDFERFSITDRINELSDLLKSRGRMLFEELFDGSRTRGDLIVTFLAILEMTRLRLTRVEQEGPLLPIFIELAVSDDAEAGSLSDDLDQAYGGAPRDLEAHAEAEPASAEFDAEPEPDEYDDGVEEEAHEPDDEADSESPETDDTSDAERK